MFQSAVHDYLPCDVPKLSDEDARGAIPDRFKGQTLPAEVQVLDFVAEEETDDHESDEDADEWEVPGTGRAEGLQPGMVEGRHAGRVEGPQKPGALRPLRTFIALAD